MHIIIVGAGMVGTQLARHLINERHDVALIEQNEERARHASNRLDCLVLNDEGNSLKTLEEAGIAKATALVCVTDSDELNMIICGLAESKYPGVLKIARVRNEDYLNFGNTGVKTLGIDHFVHPDVETARAVLNAVEHGALGDVLAFNDSPYELGAVDVRDQSVFAGMSVRDFRTVVKGETLLTLVERGEEALLPTGATTLLVGDRIHVLAHEKDMEKIFSLAGRPLKPLRKIGVVGGGRMGALIVEGLLGKGQRKKSLFSKIITYIQPRSFRNVVVIEKDYNLCKELSGRFPEALILNEDISDEGFVEEEGILDMDLIVTATENQELNMIAALYLKARGVERAVALVSGAGYATIARQLGIDVVVPMKSVVVDSILSHLLGGGIRGVHRIGEGSIEILELEVSASAHIAGKRLDQFPNSAGALVMQVSRGNDSFIPRGDYVFSPRDRIVLIVKKGAEIEIERLFGGPQ